MCTQLKGGNVKRKRHPVMFEEINVFTVLSFEFTQRLKFIWMISTGNQI